MKQYLKLFIQLMASLLVIMSATISAAQAEVVWLDFSVSESQISLTEPPSSELPEVLTNNPSSSSQLADKEAEKKVANQSILLDLSVPKAKVYSEPKATKITQETKVNKTKLPKDKEKSKNSVADKIVQIAKDRIGTNFKADVPAQCAVFVRDVFREANLEVAVSKQPFDQDVQWIDAHPARAQSFFGSDVGLLITNKEDLQPGDLVGFQNTYGKWKKGAITHVGIVVERKDNGKIQLCVKQLLDKKVLVIFRR